MLKYSLEIAFCAQRDRFAERPVEEIRTSCGKLAAIADGIIQDITDPLILQPASLDLATLRKRGGDDLVSMAFFGSIVHSGSALPFSRFYDCMNSTTSLSYSHFPFFFFQGVLHFALLLWSSSNSRHQIWFTRPSMWEGRRGR